MSPRPAVTLVFALTWGLGIACDGKGPVEFAEEGPPDLPATPVISHVHPTWMAVEASGLYRLLEVNGTGFRRTSVVRWNGEALATQPVFDAFDPAITQLQAYAPDEALGQPGEAVLTVHTPSSTPGIPGATSAAHVYSIEFAWPQFADPNPFQPPFFAPTTVDTAVIIAGYGFTSRTTARIDGQQATAHRLDFDRLQVRIMPGVLAAPGTVEVSLENPGQPADAISAATLAIVPPIRLSRGADDRLGNGCVLDSDGALWCWDGYPTRAGGSLLFDLVAAYHTWPRQNGGSCGIGRDGHTYCWGPPIVLGRGDGQPGLPVSGAPAFHQVAVGSEHACALDTNDLAWCWGSNRYGQLGAAGELDPCPDDNEPACAFAATPAADSMRFKQLTAGTRHTCGITTGGEATCWGRNESGALGIGAAGGQSSAPCSVATDLTFVRISAGGNSACGITAGGEAWCWGSNRNGQLGNGGTVDELAPVQIDGALAFRTISMGTSHACGIAEDASGWCWGLGIHGQTGGGPGTLLGSYRPSRVAGEHAWAEVRVGDTWTCGITVSGRLYCWGQPEAVPFALAIPPSVCWYTFDIPFYCYPRPTPVLGIAGGEVP